uniref:Polymerase nucleotidyl transferase domain-containing protein n=1 Tax=Strongyloides stercoralis TaxID=6248 RepID=A0AAF5CSW1_STRER
MFVRRTAPQVNNLKEIICNKNSDLLKVGSLATGLATAYNSDVDLVFMPLNDYSESFVNDFKSSSKFRLAFMNTMLEILKKNNNFDNLKLAKSSVLINARVPLLALKFKNGMKIDIQFCNYHSLRNTDLIRYYAASDVRYRKLYNFVKTLANSLKIINGKQGMLTSYQIALLVGHFLQRKSQDQQPVLPIIPKIYQSFLSPNICIKNVIENLNNPIDVSNIEAYINPKPLASHLAIQFVDYFADFDFNSNAIYMDQVLPVRQIQSKKVTKLQIFDTYSDKSISSGANVVNSFSQAMKYVQRKMRQGYFIESFPYFHESRHFDYYFNGIIY